MKRLIFALVTTPLVLSGCYIDGVGMKVTPHDVKLDYNEHQFQLTTDNDVGTMSIFPEGVHYTYVDKRKFYIENTAVVYDGKWISVVLSPAGVNRRNIYILCSENRTPQPRRCEITVRNNVGFDTAVITQEGCPEPIGTKDAECQEQHTTYLP